MIQQHEQRQKQNKFFHFSILGVNGKTRLNGAGVLYQQDELAQRAGLRFHQQDERA
jgi:hypothetical protein